MPIRLPTTTIVASECRADRDRPCVCIDTVPEVPASNLTDNPIPLGAAAGQAGQQARRIHVAVVGQAVQLVGEGGGCQRRREMGPPRRRKKGPG